MGGSYSVITLGRVFTTWESLLLRLPSPNRNRTFLHTSNPVST